MYREELVMCSADLILQATFIDYVKFVGILKTKQF